MESVLDSVKKLLNIAPDYGAFDDDIIMHINSALAHLWQIGVPQGDQPLVTGPDQLWTQVIGQEDLIPFCITYISIQARLIFDPPTSGTMSEAMNKRLSEVEWRISVQARG